MLMVNQTVLKVKWPLKKGFQCMHGKLSLRLLGYCSAVIMVIGCVSSYRFTVGYKSQKALTALSRLILIRISLIPDRKQFNIP